MTYNIDNGGKGREHLIFEILASVQPDILILQEVNNPDLTRAWAAQLQMGYVIARGETKRRVAILSRYPLLSSGSYSVVPRLSRDYLHATIEYQPNHALDVFAVHLAAEP